MTKAVVIVDGSFQAKGIVCEDQNEQVHDTVLEESVEERIAKPQELELFRVVTQ